MVNQIENAMKKCGVDPQQITKKMLNKKAFEKFIVDYLKENNQAQIVSEKFDANDKVISTTPSGKTYTVKNDKLVALKSEGGLFDYVDGDINGWFGDVTFTDNRRSIWQGTRVSKMP